MEKLGAVSLQRNNTPKLSSNGLPRRCWWFLGASLFLPHLFWGPTPGLPGSLNVGFPRIYSGDEPHYLIMINSLIQDGDLDLNDDYQRVYKGSTEAGKVFAGTHLQQHVAWVTEQETVLWKHVYEVYPERWGRDEEGRPKPRIRPGKQKLIEPLPSKNYSWHAWGLPVLLAPIAYLFHKTEFLESAMLICSGLSVVGAMYFFHMLIRPMAQNAWHAFVIVATAFFATPIYAYGRTFFSEPYLLFCVVAAFALYLRKQSGFWSGVFIGTGVLIKPAIAVVVIPLALDSLLQRQWNRLIWVAIPCLGFSLLVLFGNQLMYGSPFSFPNLPRRFVLWQDSFEYFFSIKQGLFFLAPVVVAAIAAWPGLLKSRRRDAIVIITGFLAYFTLCSSFDNGNGGHCYGPRYLVPVLPFLFVSFPNIRDLSIPEAGNWTIIILLVLSIEINLIAAIGCGNCWFSHPFELLLPPFEGPPI